MSQKKPTLGSVAMKDDNSKLDEARIMQALDEMKAEDGDGFSLEKVNSQSAVTPLPVFFWASTGGLPFTSPISKA